MYAIRSYYAELVQDVADKFQIIAREKNISINTIYSKSLPLVAASIAACCSRDRCASDSKKRRRSSLSFIV